MQGPADGTIVFTDGTGAVLAQGAATACGNCQIGLTVTFSAQGGNYGIGYGPHSGESPPQILLRAANQHKGTGRRRRAASSLGGYISVSG